MSVLVRTRLSSSAAVLGGNFRRILAGTPTVFETKMHEIEFASKIINKIKESFTVDMPFIQSDI